MDRRGTHIDDTDRAIIASGKKVTKKAIEHLQQVYIEEETELFEKAIDDQRHAMDKTEKESARSPPVLASKRAAEVESIIDQKKLKRGPVYGISAAYRH